MTGSFHSLCNTTLKFQRSSCDTTGQNLALFVQEFFQEFGIFVIDILDTVFLETAVFFLFDVDRGRGQISDFRMDKFAAEYAAKRRSVKSSNKEEVKEN